MKRETYTLEQAAIFLNVSYRTVLRLVKKAALPAFRVGHQWRILKSDLATQIHETKRRPSLGQHKVYFKIQVLNRYKTEPKYFFEEEQFSGRFGLRKEYFTKDVVVNAVLSKIANVFFQKAPTPGGEMMVCLDADYYAKTVAGVPDEYSHWHNYRIHGPQLNDK